MTLNEFQVQALRTYNDLGDKLQNSLHMTTGMASEFMDELLMARLNQDHVNILEEFGDIQWFAVVYAHIHGLKLNVKITRQQAPSVLEEDNVSIHIGALLNFDKKELAYGKVTSTEDRAVHLYGLIFALEAWAKSVLNINPEMARERVIAKLMKRFPDKFSNESAINRNLEVERTALEGGAN